MRFDIREKGSREFYEEMIYVVTKRVEILKSNKIKLNTVGNYYRNTLYLGILGIVVSLLAFIFLKMNLFFILLVIMLILMALICIAMYRTNKYVEALMNEEGTRTVEINNDGIKYKDAKKDLNYAWQDIAKVVMGDYSITFLPKNSNEFVIAIMDKYKDDVLKVINDNNLRGLLIGNVDRM